MATSNMSGKSRKLGVHLLTGSAIAVIGVVALTSSLLSPVKASQSVGGAFMAVPGIVDHMSGGAYTGWLVIEAHYWMAGPGMNMVRGIGGRDSRLIYSGPKAPASGSGPQRLVIAVDKKNAGYSRMMANCSSKLVIPELNYAESSERGREPREIGPRPADMPEYFEYKLRDVQIVDCPVVAEAPEQAFVLSMKTIEWTNYQGTHANKLTKVEVPMLTPIKVSGATKTFVVSWFGDANDVSDDQCPKMDAKPSEDEYFALMSKADADKERAELAAKKTGVSYTGQMELRGPNKLNAVKLPGIIKAQPHYTPQTKFARGLDLDGDDGTGAPPQGVCRHKNYLAEDGRKGIDNQVYTAQGCSSGLQGHKGFYWQYANEQRRNGTNHIMVQISGIDNERNDDLVYVTFLFTDDVMAKNADGSKILADFTYRLNTIPEFAQYTARMKGRIVNGAITTERVKLFRMHTGLGGELKMHNAGVRLQIMPDGSLKGIVAGYQDWRELVPSSSVVELNYSLNAPVLYGALKRYADGLKDPATGVCNGISSTFDIEGSAAFIPPAQARTLVADAAPQGRPQVRKAR